MYNFKVNEQEAKFLIQVLAELPTRTNAYILYRNLTEQMAQQENPQVESELPAESEEISSNLRLAENETTKDENPKNKKG